MAGKMDKATHQDGTEFEGPVDTGNPHAKRPLDKKQGDGEFDQAANKDKGKVFDSGKVAEQVKALFADVQGLSEDFTTKATVIFEGALSEKIETIREELQEAFDAKVEAAVIEQQSDIEDRLDSYLGFVIENFMKENEVAIDNGIKNDLAEQVMESVASIIESAGVALPEDKVDVADALAEELKDVESKLNEQIKTNVILNDENKKFRLQEAFREVSADLSVAGREKLARLAENISYTDIEDYKARVTILKETATADKPVDTAKTLNEQVVPEDKTQKSANPRMAEYLKALRG